MQGITDCCGKLRLFFLGENRSFWTISRSHTGWNSLSPYAEGAWGRPINQQLLNKFNLDPDEWECMELDTQLDYERIFLETSIEGLERFNEKYFGANKHRIPEREQAWEGALLDTFCTPRYALERNTGAELLLGIIIFIAVAVTYFS